MTSRGEERNPHSKWKGGEALPTWIEQEKVDGTRKSGRCGRRPRFIFKKEEKKKNQNASL